MRRTFSALWIALLAGACASTDGPTGGGADCSDFSTTGESPSCEQLCAVSNEAFCGGITSDLDCSALPPGAQVDVCGVPMSAPVDSGELLELERSATVEENAGTGPPDLGCFETDGFPEPPGESKMVTLEGVAEIFSHGCESDQVQIEVFTVVRDGSDDEGMPDQLVGQAVVTAEDCTVDGKAEDNDNCLELDGKRWECAYQYPDVPSETELMIVTSGAGWTDLYEYNVWVDNDDVVDGIYEKDVSALAADDYTTIPQTVKGEQMRPGFGAIGGEVHDCGDVRLTQAIVDVDTDRVLTYFGDDEVQPLPKPGATSTSTLGLYAALDVEAGPVNVAAAGVVDGALVGLGVHRVRVFPDSVTSLTFRGLQPYQLP